MYKSLQMLIFYAYWIFIQRMISFIRLWIQSTKYVLLILFSHHPKYNSFIAVWSYTCISQTHAWLLVKNAHVTLFHGYSSSVLTHHVPRGVLPAWVFIGSIWVCATTDLAAGWTASTYTLTLNVLAWNVITKLPCTYWYWFLCLFIHIVVSFCRKRDEHVKIVIFDVGHCSV